MLVLCCRLCQETKASKGRAQVTMTSQATAFEESQARRSVIPLQAKRPAPSTSCPEAMQIKRLCPTAKLPARLGAGFTLTAALSTSIPAGGKAGELRVRTP